MWVVIRQAGRSPGGYTHLPAGGHPLMLPAYGALGESQPVTADEPATARSSQAFLSLCNAPRVNPVAVGEGGGWRILRSDRATVHRSYPSGQDTGGAVRMFSYSTRYIP